MPHVSLARFKPWMTMSKAERTPSRPFGCWDVEAIVEASGGREETARGAVWKFPNPNADGRPFNASNHTHFTNICRTSRATVHLDFFGLVRPDKILRQFATVSPYCSLKQAAQRPLSHKQAAALWSALMCQNSSSCSTFAMSTDLF
jgi:hypothetical protein